MGWYNNVDRQESLEFRPGQKVELKNQPGVMDTIAEYDPMMVPPIWLANDPQPRYPEELTLVENKIWRLGKFISGKYSLKLGRWENNSLKAAYRMP